MQFILGLRVSLAEEFATLGPFNRDKVNVYVSTALVQKSTEIVGRRRVFQNIFMLLSVHSRSREFPISWEK
jgi:hypothetical protein